MDSKPRGLRNLALLAVMRDGMLRSAEARSLTVGDVSYEKDGSGRLLIRRSKTDKVGKGTVLYLRPSTVLAVKAWLAIREGVDAAAPLFCRMLRRGGTSALPLTSETIRTVLKRLASASSIVAKVSGHSCRVGMAQDLAEKGATLPEMMTAGRWSSPSI